MKWFYKICLLCFFIPIFILSAQDETKLNSENNRGNKIGEIEENKNSQITTDEQGNSGVEEKKSRIAKGFLEIGDKIKMPGGNAVATVIDEDKNEEADGFDYNNDKKADAKIIITEDPRVVGIDMNKDGMPDYYFYFGVNRRIYLSNTKEIDIAKLQELQIEKIQKWSINIGDIIQLPGGSSSGTIIDSNKDSIADAIDFNADGKGDLKIVPTENPNAIGIDANFDGMPEYFLIAKPSGEIVISTSPFQIEGNLSDDKGQKLYQHNDWIFSLGGFYNYSTLELSQGKLSGYGGVFSLEIGLDDLLIVKKFTANKRRIWMPAWYNEINFLNLNQPSLDFQNIIFSTGPNFIMHLNQRRSWRVNAGLLMGLSFFHIKSSFFDINSMTTTVGFLSGIAWTKQHFGIHLNFHFLLMSDSSYPIYNGGASLALSYTL